MGQTGHLVIDYKLKGGRRNSTHNKLPKWIKNYYLIEYGTKTILNKEAREKSKHVDPVDKSINNFSLYEAKAWYNIHNDKIL